MTPQPQLNVIDAITQRRAARAFLSTPIPEATLAEIFRLGLQAPSGYNLQPWRFIKVTSQASKEKLQACAFNQRQVVEAPVVLICCGDRNINAPAYIEQIIELGQSVGGVSDQYADFMRGAIPQLFENHPCFESIEAWTNRHTMLAVAHLMIAAKALGVDSCPMEGFMTVQVKTEFKIPDHVDVCCLLPLGYAADPKKLYGGRFEQQQVIYEETYGSV